MSIIIHPEFEKLKNRLSDLIIEYDELVFKICPNIEAEYLLNFGFLEYDLYKKDVELSKIKRKFQLMRIQVNNQETIDIDFINEVLDEEFIEYEKKLKKQMDELDNLSNISMVKTLSKDDSKKLKSIYKKCVLKLHPDLNKNLSDHEKDLFLLVTESFKNEDLNTLESLYYSIENEVTDHDFDEIKLTDLIDDLESKIKKIKDSFPYNKKELVEDSAMSKKYKEDLKKLLEQFEKEIRKYNDKIIDLNVQYSKEQF